MSDHHATSYDSIAIVGAGIAGLTAACELTRAGARVTVYDKGRGVGGRTATRRAENSGQFDHGAQYFTVRDERFARQTQRWVAEGVAVEWSGKISSIVCDESGARPAPSPEPKTRYVGSPGMNALAQALAEQAARQGAAITTGVRVASLKRQAGRWRLTTDAGEPLGDHSQVLVTAPAPQAAELLIASPALANAAKSVQTAPCWAAMAAFDRRLEISCDAAFVAGEPERTPLSWIARDSSKPERPAAPGGEDCWVLHGSPGWSAANLDLSPDEAAERLLVGLFAATGARPQQPALLMGHRWRFATPENPLPDAALCDAPRGLYAAGDWCAGPRVEGAFLSGLAAAAALASG